MAFTHTPCCAHSIARDFVRDPRAALLAEYAATSYRATNVPSDAILMIRPYRRSSMCGPNTWQARRTPVKFVSTIWLHSDCLNVSVGSRFVRPAELTRISILPNDSTARDSRFCNDSRSETSEQTLNDRRPRLSISEAAFSTCSTLRDDGTTFAPASARPCAMARPIPDVPPMTTATFPVRSRGLKLIFIQLSIWRVPSAEPPDE